MPIFMRTGAIAVIILLVSVVAVVFMPIFALRGATVARPILELKAAIAAIAAS